MPRESFRDCLSISALLLVALLVAGCGAGGSGSTPAPPVTSPGGRITLTPGSATVIVRSKLALSATITGAADQRVTYSVVEQGTGAAISSAGVLTAAPSAGTLHVRATSVADPGIFAEAVVTTRPYRDALRQIPSIPMGLVGHSADKLADGSVLVAGGIGQLNTVPASSLLFRPSTGTFEPIAPIGQPRIGHSSARLPDGRVLLAGGYLLHQIPALASTEVFDPATQTFSPGPTLVSPRYASPVVTLPDGSPMFIGGLAFRSQVFATPSVESYESATGRMRSRANMLQPRWGHTATRLLDGRVLVTGGRENTLMIDPYVATLRTAEIYNPASDTWQPTGSMRFSRIDHLAAILPDGRVLIAGGTTTEDIGPIDQVLQTEIFDPATGTFSLGPTLVHPHTSGNAVVLNDGRVLLLGGTNSNGTTIEKTEIYNPVSGSITPGPDMRDWRMKAAVSLLDSGEVLIVGGDNSGGPMSLNEIMD